MTGKTRALVVEGAIVLLIGLLALTRVFLQVRVGAGLSPLDEHVFVDYVFKVPTQGVVYQGEELGQAARQVAACQAWAQTDALRAACATGDFGNRLIYPQLGITSADLYTPVYPTLTWLGMNIFNGLGAANDLSAMRYTGAIWLALASMGMWLLARKEGLSPWACLGASLAIIAITPIRWANAFVTPDATAMLAGVLMLIMAGWWVRWSKAGMPIILPAMTFALLAAFFTAMKLQNFFAVVLAGVWILLRLYAGSLKRLIPDTLYLAAVAIIGLLPQVFWVMYRAEHAVGPFPDQQVTQPFSYGLLFAELLRYIPGLGEGTGAPSLIEEPWGYLVAQWMMIVVVLGTVGVAVALNRNSRFWRLGIATLFAAMVGGPALLLASSMASHGFIPSPERYGLSMIPAALLGAAAFFDLKPTSRVIWALCGAASVTVWIFYR